MNIVNSKEFGNIGEKITCKYLKKNNYRIMETNFVYRGGEIDIIAYDINKDEVVFIEVKTRANRKYGRPADSVNNFKVNRIVRGAKYYLFKNCLNDANVRFDILELYYSHGIFFVNQIKQII